MIGNASDNVDRGRRLRVPPSRSPAGPATDTLDALNDGPATVSGGDGNDTLIGGSGQTAFSGGTGTDVVDYSAAPAAVTVHLDGSAPSGTADQISQGDGDTFDGTVEQVYGSAFNDTLYGTSGNNAIFGNAGNDTIYTMGGTDAVFAGDGNDTVYANDGGPTYIDGGTGTDTAYVDPTGDTTVNVENVIGATSTVHQLTGTTIGTAGSYANQGNTIAKATDGSLSTFFDAPTASGAYVGIDLGSAQVVTQIKFAPRSGYASRMVGGVFQASSSASFASPVTVYTVSATPAQGSLTAVNVSAGSGFRYWRYVGPTNGECNIAEFQLYGSGSTTPTSTQLTGTNTSTAGSYRNQGNTAAKATDGNLSTFFDAPTASGSYVGLDLGSARVVTQLGFAPRGRVREPDGRRRVPGQQLGRLLGRGHRVHGRLDAQVRDGDDGGRLGRGGLPVLAVRRAGQQQLQRGRVPAVRVLTPAGG